MDVVGPVGGQPGAQPGIGLEREQAARLIRVIVVPREHFPGGVGEAQDRVERRAEPAGLDFGDDLAAGAALEPEDIRFAGALDAAVDDDRQRDRLRGLHGVVRLDRPAFGQRIHRILDVVGDAFIAAPCRLPDVGAAGLGIERNRCSGRFQPMIAADAGAPACPPSGNTCVMNGCSPMETR